MTREDLIEAIVGSVSRRKVAYVRIGRFNVEVIKNPTDADIRQIRKVRGLVKFGGSNFNVIRAIWDASGNKYIWDASDGLHSDLVSLIKKKFGIRNVKFAEPRKVLRKRTA